MHDRPQLQNSVPTMPYPLQRFDTVHLVFTESTVQCFLYPQFQTHAEIASQWNSVQRQDFFQRSPIDECQRVQAVNAGNLIFSLDVVQTAGRNHKRRLPVLFRKRHTCRVNIAQRPSDLLTDRPQFCAGICLPLPLGHERFIVNLRCCDSNQQREKPHRMRPVLRLGDEKFYPNRSCCLDARHMQSVPYCFLASNVSVVPASV